MATTRDEALYIKAQAGQLPNSNQNRPMRQNIIDSADRLLIANPDTPPAATIVAVVVSIPSGPVYPNTAVQCVGQVQWSDGSITTPSLAWSATAGTIGTTGLWSGLPTPGSATITAKEPVTGKQGSTTLTVVAVPPSPTYDPQTLYDDSFTNGQRLPAQNGVGFMFPNAGPSDRVVLEPGAQVFEFAGNADLTDDSWAEANYRLTSDSSQGLLQGFIGMEWECDAAYFHRTCWDATQNKYVSPGNNKQCVIYAGAPGSSRDQAYQNPLATFGTHLWPYPHGDAREGNSKLHVGFGYGAGTVGDYGTGPWTEFFQKQQVQRHKVGIFWKCGTFRETGDGPGSCTQIGDGWQQVWIDGSLVYDYRNLPTYGPGLVGCQYFYLPGWSNSGFNATTQLRLRRLLVSRKPHPDFAAVG